MNLDEQVDLLMAGTEYGDDETRQSMTHALRDRLAEGRPLRVYLGVDATAPDLHIGHAVPMRKLAQFQQLGHECCFLIGDFTALIGDPTDRDKTRPRLTREQIAENVETFARQAFRLLDPERTAIRYNSEWLSKLTFQDLIELAGLFTVAQFLDRENFGKRYEEGHPIYLHEFFYPLMQGYDATALKTDVQLGGTDQTFNIMSGRKVQEAFGQKPQVVITLPLLPGTDGRQKMSKSLGNGIPIETTPEDMYGKLMSIPDSALGIYLAVLTSTPPEGVDRVLQAIEAGQQHPRDVKMAMAREVTAQFHGSEAAERAEREFVTVFQRHEAPPDMPVHHLNRPARLLDLLADLGLAPTRNEARRVIEQGGVRLAGERIIDPAAVIWPSSEPRVLRVGKHTFIELRRGEDGGAADTT